MKNMKVYTLIFCIVLVAIFITYKVFDFSMLMLVLLCAGVAFRYLLALLKLKKDNSNSPT